ncbi:TetR/AcrR family transcriptional regulator [Crocinitomix catalasitica]|uniref:TetR/AcrR family transcriptional regulator n=1 Tax=Crocinitomix catalasitica TaxID=184607 RepID=UPI0004837324|nr:TetR/AcrR family transcriptional regulator [Crocinitomix catalasitica]
MDNLLSNIKIKVNDKVFIKDPESSELGKRIVQGTIGLIDEIGFEQFTFKKLAKEIKTSEASIYRYFDSKHHLLVYITLWYWGWMEYRIVFKLMNIESAEERLTIAVKTLTEVIEEDKDFNHINKVKLHRIVIRESSKIYLNKSVDNENSEGFFLAYKRLVERVVKIILEINPTYKYPHMLVSTIIEGAHHQRYFAKHLPRLTDIVNGEDAVTTFYQKMALTQLKD